jgi:hypothetical protein
MKPYVIRQGDYLTKLAHQRGFDATAIWNDPKNARIRDKRTEPNLLHPGDILWIPDAPEVRRLAVKSGSANRYVANIPKMPVEVRLQVGGAPLAKEPYQILGLGPDPIEGATDDDGWLKATVPVHVREIEVLLTEKDRTLRVRVGDLDPVDTLSGLKKRLTHLGFYQPSRVGIENDDVADDDALVSALKAFQSSRDIGPTGKLDDDTRKALTGAHGS